MEDVSQGFPLESWSRPAHTTSIPLFNIISILTGTGYVNAQFDNWGSFSLVLFLILMFIGGCAGSTTCGVKIFRLQMLLIFLKNQVRKLIYPNSIIITKYNFMPPSARAG